MAVCKAMLFDRDGTLIADKHYLADPDGVELLPGVGEALGCLARRGVRLFLVSNQSGIGRGMFSLECAQACNDRLAALLKPYGVVFDEMLFCPHAPEKACSCRKPATGMWEKLRQSHSLDPDHCLMAGDKIEDMLFAANAGLAARVLLLTGKGKAAAEQLRLDLPPGPVARLFCPPPSPSHPHLCITDFTLLEKGLSLLHHAQENTCNA